MDFLLQHFSDITSVPENLRQELLKRVQLHSFKRNEVIQPADKVCKRTYLVKKGLLRIYFSKDDKIITDGFAAENEWMTSAYSFMRAVADQYEIATIEPTQAYSLSLEDLMYLFEHFHEMERFGRIVMSMQFIQQSERLSSIRFTTPKEKYEHFCNTYKYILGRVPLGMIASYLGITQETLSRVRAGS
jgi:CRP-like cAMP-binding protein